LDFNNFWYNYSRLNLPSNGYSSLHLTQHMLLQYLWKLKHIKNSVEMNKKTPKTICDITDSNLEKDNEIFIVLWYKHFWYNWPLNGRSNSQLT